MMLWRFLMAMVGLGALGLAGAQAFASYMRLANEPVITPSDVLFAATFGFLILTEVVLGIFALVCSWKGELP